MSLLNIYILDLVMIKLFDFKFLILLTLAVVIYFMYKDMDEQRDRIQKLEEAYRAQLHNQNPEEKEEIPLPPKQQFLPQKQVVSQKEFVVQKQFVPQKQFVQQNEVNNLKLELPNKMAVKTDFIALNKEKVELPKELPVYLEKDEENDILEEDDNLEENNLEENNLEENNLEENNLEESNLEESSESESEEEESSSTYISKKSKKSVLEIYSNDNDNLEETSISNSLIENKLNVNASEELEDVLNNLEIEILQNTTKYELNNLSKLKVSELQDLAKKENITLDKKVNGANKKKTKQELIDELLNLNIS